MHLGPAKEARLLAYHQNGIRVSTELQIDKQVTKFRVRTRDCYGLASKKNRVDARKGSCKTDTCVLATLCIRDRRPLASRHAAILHSSVILVHAMCPLLIMIGGRDSGLSCAVRSPPFHHISEPFIYDA